MSGKNFPLHVAVSSTLCLALFFQNGIVYGRTLTSGPTHRRNAWAMGSRATAWTPEVIGEMVCDSAILLPVSNQSSRRSRKSVTRPLPFTLEVNERQELMLVRTGVNRIPIVKKVRDRVESRIELTSKMMKKGTHLISRASHFAVTSATSRSLGAKLVSDCHALLGNYDPTNSYLGKGYSIAHCKTRNVITTALIRKSQIVALVNRSRRYTSSPAQSSPSNGILTCEERDALITRTEVLMESVMYALSHDHLWTQVNQQDGVTVWKTAADVKNYHPSSTPKEDQDATTVRSEAIMHASPHEVNSLFNNDDRVHEYNENCVQLQDLEMLSNNAKINWSATSKFGPFSARDFVTLVTYRYLGPEHGYVSLAASVEHPKLAAVRDGYVRSQIQLAATFMKPVRGDPNKTRFVQVMQVGNLGGVADSPLAKRIKSNLELKAPVDFVKKFNSALLRCPDGKKEV